MPAGRTTPTGRFALEIGGMTAGYLASAAGGSATADVVVEQAGGVVPKKHLGAIRYEDVRISCAAVTAAKLIPWLTETLSGKPSRKSGAILSIDAAGKVAGALDFTNALLSEVSFPALDGA